MKKYFLYFLIIIPFLVQCQNAIQENRSSKSDEINQIKTDSLLTQPADITAYKLMKAYPGHFKTCEKNKIIWKDGTEMPLEDGNNKKTFLELLNEADLEDQVLNMKYTKGIDFPTPVQRQDPGRVRYEPFFKKMYGASEQEVRSKLTKIIWLPKSLKVELMVTTVNDIHLKLQKISEQLDTMPHLLKYLKNPGGTFTWRKIAGTDRMSLHSFGMTIDINVEFSDYWRWAVKDANEDGSREITYKNRIPLEIVKIFEEQGFIWGGKWYHYDTMHFEYRPELLLD